MIKVKTKSKAKPVSLNKKKGKLWADIVKNKYIYIMLIPVVIQYVIFRYIPIYGVQLAFKKFSAAKGIWGSKWIGLENFRQMLAEPGFINALGNTVAISVIMLLGGAFAAPVMALIINEFRLKKYKRVLQTTLTFPHFLSWVMTAGILYGLFSSDGIINDLLIFFGLPKQDLLTNPSTFRGFLLASHLWKELGWMCIIYLAILTGVDGSLYEAARIDGASRIQCIRHISVPALLPYFSLNLVLAFSGLLDGNFDQIFNMYNSMLYDVADTIDTYIYRISFMQTPSYGFSVAVGFSKAVVASLLLLLSNTVSKAVGGKGIFEGGTRS